MTAYDSWGARGRTATALRLSLLVAGLRVGWLLAEPS